MSKTLKIYSNSWKWCCALALVGKTAVRTITITFQHLNAKPNEQSLKELPLNIEDLRKPEVEWYV